MTIRPIMLGDLVEKCLSLVGINSTRIEWLLGIKPNTCGCKGRQSALNKWSASVQFPVIMFFGGPGELPLRHRIRVAKRKISRRISSGIKRPPLPDRQPEMALAVLASQGDGGRLDGFREEKSVDPFAANG